MGANERPRLRPEADATDAERHPESTPSSRSEPTPRERQPEAITLTDALACLTAVLPRLAEAVEKAQSKPRPDRLAFRRDELAEALGISAPALERSVQAGNLPRPDLHIGTTPLWRVDSIRAWLDSLEKAVRR